MTRAAARTNTVNASGGGGGTVNDGVLQIQGGVPISGSLTPITDQIGNLSPIRVSATEVAFDVSIGINRGPAVGYDLATNGNILTMNVHVGGSSSLVLSGYNTNVIGTFAPTGGGFEANVNSVAIFRADAIKAWSKTYMDFGDGSVDANRPAIGASLLHATYSQNGEYLRFQSGHNQGWAYSNYYFNVPNRTFNTTPSDANRLAAVIQIPNHIFSITNSGAQDVNYRGLSLTYTVNNTVTATGVASGISVDTLLTNLNGMSSRGFYYNIDGAGAAVATINPGGSITSTHKGIILQNSRTATTGQQSYAPSIQFISNVWNTSSGGSSASSTWEILTLGGQALGAFSLLGIAHSGVLVAQFEPTGFVVGAASNPIGITASTLSLGPRSSSANFNAVSCFINFSGNVSATSGDSNGFRLGGAQAFNPTSGNATLNGFRYDPIINQTGSANGITRGVWINPTLTSAPDFRAYEASFTFNAPASSSHTFRGINLNYTINNSASQTGTGTGIFLNTTITALNGMTHKGFYHSINGTGVASNTAYTGIELENTVAATSGNQQHSPYIIFGGQGWKTNATAASQPVKVRMGLVPVQGTTNPGHAFVIASSVNDGAYTGAVNIELTPFSTIYVGSFGVVGSGANSTITFTNTSIDLGGSGGGTLRGQAAVFGSTTLQASAHLEIVSTTRGFLPPRMTTTQKNAISSPATGLVVYDTTLNKLCVFTGTVWETVTSA